MNPILLTDSYKLTHWKMYPDSTRFVHSYLEPRTGKGLQSVVWFGLQAILKDFKCPNMVEVYAARDFAAEHFGSDDIFNFSGWKHLAQLKYLPLRIKALPEGAVVGRGESVMTVENTHPDFPWLTNWAESFLMHVWYPSTVASTSYDLRKFMIDKLKGHDSSFMLHDFGYRGVSSDQSAAIGGAAHLLSFNGTDTLPALELIKTVYRGNLAGFSVPASEHSIMTQYGQDGETKLLEDLIRKHPGQILSLVADSYDVYDFARKLKALLPMAFEQQTKIVIRPDSITQLHPTPSGLVNWLLDIMPESVNVLWGDGLESDEIKHIITASNQPTRLVFGMGGGLLQKCNRDTLRWAMKCSAVSGDGKTWFPVQKNPLDQSKASKPGRQDAGMRTIWEDGQLLVDEDWATIKGRVREQL